MDGASLFVGVCWCRWDHIIIINFFASPLLYLCINLHQFLHAQGRYTVDLNRIRIINKTMNSLQFWVISPWFIISAFPINSSFIKSNNNP